METMEKHYDFITAEPAMQALWREKGTYAFDKAPPGELFSIDTPPPTVSGDLHMGHIFSYAQTEIVGKFVKPYKNHTYRSCLGQVD